MKCGDCPHLDIPEDQKRGSCCIDQMPGHRALEARLAAAKAAGEGLPRQQRRAAQRQAMKRTIR